MVVTETKVEEGELLPNLSPQAEIALLARALFRSGWDDHEVGHITYRQENDTFFTLPFELGWDEVKASDVLRMDLEGRKLEGRWKVTPPILLHTEFHKARPGVNVTIHQHPRYCTVWSACGRVPPAYDQRSASLSEADIAFYDEYEGGVSGLEAAIAAVRGIGQASVALLRNHGAFVAGDSIGQAFNRATSLEWRCMQAWRVEAIGGDRVMPVEGQQMILDFMKNSLGEVRPYLWPWAVRRELRADPDILA